MTSNKIKKINLSSGAKLLHIQNSSLPYDIVSVWLMAGSRFEPLGKEGLAHLFEHLLMYKTSKHPNKIERLNILESNGIYSNAATNREFVYYHQSQLKEKTMFSLGLLLDGLRNSITDSQSLENEKKIVFNESLSQKNNPTRYIWDLNFRSIFKNTRVARSLFGSKESLDSIGIEDIEEYRAKYYQPANFYFVIISPLPTDRFVKMINKYLADWKKTSLSLKKEKFTAPDKLLIEKGNLNQPQVSYNFRILSPSVKEIIILNFINNYLTDTWISRLIVRLRLENNLTYWVNGSNFYYHDAGYFSFIFSSETKKLNKIFSIIKEEVDVLKNKPIDQMALKAHKMSFKSSFIRHTCEPSDLLFYYGHAFVMDRQIFNVKEFLRHIDNITAKQIQVVAKKYLTKENLSVSIIGNIQEKDIKV